MKFYKQRKNFQVPKSRKIFNHLRSTPKFSTEENTCLYYTNYARSRTMADCHNIQALIHCLFLRSFLYSFTNPNVYSVCWSAAVWIYQAGYWLLLNCFFSLNSYLIVNNLSQL